MVKVVEEGRMRCTDKSKSGVNLRLQESRQSVVQDFKSTQMEFNKPFRCFDAAIYEKNHPGRIAKMNLQKVMGELEGVRKEVVLIPKLEDGEYECNLKA